MARSKQKIINELKDENSILKEKLRKIKEWCRAYPHVLEGIQGIIDEKTTD